MTNPTAVRCGIILSAAAAMSGSTGQYVYAYPADPIVSVAVSAPFLTRIDTRSYRHCHNRPTGIYVDCYTREPGEHEAQTPRQRYWHSGGANALSDHHPVRNRSFGL